MNTLTRYSRNTFSSLKIPNYRLYFIAQIISVTGIWMQNIAQVLLVLQLTGSGTALGFLVALQFVPMLLFGSFGGVLADRFSKRKILLCTQTIAGSIALIQGILIATHNMTIWWVYVLAFCLGLVNAFDSPTRQTFIFEMVGKEQLKNAVSLNSVMANLARVIGPSLAGILVTTVGFASCFFLNAFSYLAVLFVLVSMNVSQLHPVEKAKELRGQFTKGLQYVRANPSLRNILVMMLIVGTFTYEFQVILPLFAQFTFNNPTIGYTVLMSAMGMGAILGGLEAASRKKSSMKVLIMVSFLFGISMLTAAVASNLYIAAAAMVVVGFFSINFNSLSNTMLQIKSAPEMRGRVISLWAIAFFGTTPIGGPIIGYIGEHFGPRYGMGVGGIAAILAAILGLLLVKHDREQAITPEEQIIVDREMSMR